MNYIVTAVQKWEKQISVNILTITVCNNTDLLYWRGLVFNSRGKKTLLEELSNRGEKRGNKENKVNLIPFYEVSQQQLSSKKIKFL